MISIHDLLHVRSSLNFIRLMYSGTMFYVVVGIQDVMESRNTRVSYDKVPWSWSVPRFACCVPRHHYIVLGSWLTDIFKGN